MRNLVHFYNQDRGLFRSMEYSLQGPETTPGAWTPIYNIPSLPGEITRQMQILTRRIASAIININQALTSTGEVALPVSIFVYGVRSTSSDNETPRSVRPAWDPSNGKSSGDPMRP